MSQVRDVDVEGVIEAVQAVTVTAEKITGMVLSQERGKERTASLAEEIDRLLQQAREPKSLCLVALAAVLEAGLRDVVASMAVEHRDVNAPTLAAALMTCVDRVVNAREVSPGGDDGERRSVS